MTARFNESSDADNSFEMRKMIRTSGDFRSFASNQKYFLHNRRNLFSKAAMIHVKFRIADGQENYRE